MSKAKGARLVAKGSGWIIRWRDQAGCVRERRCVGRTHEEATQELAAFVLTEPSAGTLIGPRDPSQFGIAEALITYLTEHAAYLPGASPETARYNAKRLGSWWGESKVDAITQATCARYVRDRQSQGVASSTAARELSVLAAAVNHAFREGRLTRAPAVVLPAAPPPKDRWLTRSEAARLLRESRRDDQARNHLPLFIRIALYTGARVSAILDITWPQIDFVRNTIDLNPPGRRRTSKGRARMPLPRHLAAALRRAQRRAVGPYVITENGKRLGSVKRSFASACARAGFDDVTPHTLRHTCGTWLAMAGVPLWDIAGWLGHSMSTTTERYAHHSPEHLVGAKQALDRSRRTPPVAEPVAGKTKTR
ncbi:MAG: tyrosine-type recombinase/integrase [Azospirillum sp.]|nr:tyrosine-type recombinase/integrase [Azospirillum sp.]